MLSRPRLPSFSGNISVMGQWLGKLAQTDTSSVQKPAHKGSQLLLLKIDRYNGRQKAKERIGDGSKLTRNYY
jgi:hypothetical protein